MRPGGQPNMKDLMKLQRQLAAAQQALAETEVTGTAGGGLVTVTMTASGEFRAIKIDPKAVDPDDVETLEDLVLAAVHNATEAGREMTEEKMGPLTGGLGGLGMPGF
jgi:DNA-binding YbaB/EbfC family protein